MAQRQEETGGEIKHVVNVQVHQHTMSNGGIVGKVLYYCYAGQHLNIGFITETLCRFLMITLRGAMTLSLKLGATVGSQYENDQDGPRQIASLRNASSTTTV